MTLPVWLILSALLGCEKPPDPSQLRAMNCDNCGSGQFEDVLLGCDACYEIAHEALSRPRPDIDLARESLSKACQVHHPPSCGKLGEMVRDGRGGPRDAKRAADLFTIACNKGGLQYACTEVGLAAYDGVGMRQDQPKGVAMFEQACFHESQPQPKACAALGLAWFSGKGVEKKDEEKAIELLNKACDSDYAPGCVAVGDLFVAYTKGKKKENVETAAIAYERACKLDPRHGCFELAKLHDEKKVEEPSDEKAAIFYQKTCNIDPTRGCYEAAELMASGKVPAREGEVASLYNIACEHGHTEACAKRNAGDF